MNFVKPASRLGFLIHVLGLCCIGHAKTGWANEHAGIGGRETVAGLAEIPLETLLDFTVVTTASKFAQPVSQAPSAVVVLSAADIKTFGWRNLGDALATLPGLYTSYDRNYAYLGARGYLRPGDYGSRFLLLIDGERSNNPLYDQASIGSEFLLDMDTVERIEYVPGPGSAIYGANAFFGTINVVTKKGGAYRGLEAAAAYGGFGEKKARLTYGRHWGDGGDLVLSTTSYERNGRDLYYAQFDTADQNNGVARNLDYDRALNLLAKATYGDVEISLMHVARTKGVPTASYGAAFNLPYATQDTQSLAGIKYAREINEKFSVDGSIYAGRYDYEARSHSAAPASQPNVDGSGARWYSVDVHATSTHFARQKLLFGVSLQRDARKTQYHYRLEPYSLQLDDRRSADHAGVYLEDEISLPYGFIVNAGARFDTVTASGSSVNPRVALIKKLTRDTTVKAIYGTAYRAPNAYEMYYAVGGDSGQEGNPSLRPERIATQELVLDHAFGGATHGTLSLFRYRINDLISQTVNPGNGLYVFKNLDHAQAKGAEFNLNHKWAKDAAIRASYSWQLARDDVTRNVLDNSPRAMAKVNLAFPLIGEAMLVGAEARYIARRNTAVGEVPSYSLANLTVNWPRLIKNADVSISAYNLFDKRYADPAGPGLTQPYVRQDGRTFLFKIVCRL